MSFSSALLGDLSHLEIFYVLEDEMSKYKTLNHEKINWDIVYNNSLNILKNTSMDIKICNYFILSCINLNKDYCFIELSNLLIFLKDFLQNNPQSLNNTNLNNIKTKVKKIVSAFILETTRLELFIPDHTLIQINHTLLELSDIISHKFATLKTLQTTPLLHTNVDKVAEISTNSLEFENPNTLDNRKYREFYLNLSLSLLENDLNNLNAYTFFFEAMWGKMKKLPPHKENITQIRYPDNVLINLLHNQKGDSNDFERIQIFIKTLTLNPLWFDGLQLFHKLLISQRRDNICRIFKIFVNEFLNKFREITKLKFENGKFLCDTSTFDYFSKDYSLNSQKKVINSKTPQKSIIKNFEEAFLKINQQNSNGSSFSNINALIEMAKLFDEKQMQQNATIIYLLLKEKLENTLLKDYLEDYYLFIKEKINKN